MTAIRDSVKLTRLELMRRRARQPRRDVEQPVEGEPDDCDCPACTLRRSLMGGQLRVVLKRALGVTRLELMQDGEEPQATPAADGKKPRTH